MGNGPKNGLILKFAYGLALVWNILLASRLRSLAGRIF